MFTNAYKYFPTFFKHFSRVFKGRKYSKDEKKPDMLTMANTPEMVESVNELILAERRVKTEDISDQQEISVDTANKIGHDDLAFSEVSYR